MQMPERIRARWIDALTDDELYHAEGELHARFRTLDAAERSRRGPAYDLLKGPEALTGAWLRWSMVSAAARARGLRVWRHR